MIARLHGRIDHKEAGRVIIECGGVGYELQIPLCAFFELPELGKQARLEVFTLLREDSIQLYGFLKPSEKLLFQKLLGISGVGPKLALALLSKSSDALLAAIRAGDAATLRSLPGVGKKTAERILLELRDALGGIESSSAAPLELPAGTPRQDAISALLNLGYPERDAVNAVDAAAAGAADQDLQTLLTRALAQLGRGR